jgi:hypothetical protein
MGGDEQPLELGQIMTEPRVVDRVYGDEEAHTELPPTVKYR